MLSQKLAEIIGYLWLTQLEHYLMGFYLWVWLGLMFAYFFAFVFAWVRFEIRGWNDPMRSSFVYIMKFTRMLLILATAILVWNIIVVTFGGILTTGLLISWIMVLNSPRTRAQHLKVIKAVVVF